MSETIADPFTVTGDSDPFATADDAASHAGPFIPWPKIDDVQERLIVLVPRKYDEEAKVSEFAQRTYGMPATQPEWRTDLVVLDGGKLEYAYKAKKEGTDSEYVDATWTVDTLPTVIPNWRVTAGNMIGTINRVHDGPKPFVLGRIRAGYTAKEMRAGRTFEEFAKELADFERSPRGKKQPKPVWHMVVSDDAADRAVALSWWRAAQADGFKI